MKFLKISGLVTLTMTTSLFAAPILEPNYNYLECKTKDNSTIVVYDQTSLLVERSSGGDIEEHNVITTVSSLVGVQYTVENQKSFNGTEIATLVIPPVTLSLNEPKTFNGFLAISFTPTTPAATPDFKYTLLECTASVVNYGLTPLTK